LLRRGGDGAYDIRVTPYVPINPVTLVCPQCGATAGQACKILIGELGPTHIERILAAATKDVAAKEELGKNTHYAEKRERKLKKLLERISNAEGRT
jgi:hypothetical protein